MKILHSFVVIEFFASAAIAQGGPQTPWAQHVVQSATLGDSRTVYVATPSDYAASKDRYPVLVLLDANDRPQFASAVANVQFLASRNAIPSLIIVGILNGKDRTHDLTPATTGAFDKRTFPTAGGAAPFADFITDEIMAMVRAKYRTLPSTVLAGHSFGGLLALHAAATRPGTYAGIVAMSPSLWWDDSTAAIGYADSIAKSPATRRLFATSGALEPPIDITVRRFAARLETLKPATLAFGYRHYDDDNHGLTPVPSLMDGLRFVFEPVSLAKSPLMVLGPSSDSAAVMNAFVATEDAYGRGARLLAMPERLPESFVNSMGYVVLQQFKFTNLAIWLLRRNAVNYPDSPNVFDSLGDGLLAAGDSSAAKAQFRHAIDLASHAGTPVSDATRKKLTALEHTTQTGKPRPQR